ncbi:hypothetical protein [Microbaculum marinum]|uniref:Uncharacterized protein n=1 Tax=Microbaculum marinum TaxID=1764581 RepID=A0AAW9RNB8_9HYPH
MTSNLLGAAIGAATLLLAFAPAVTADDLSTLSAEARKAVAEGRTVEALDLADQFSRAVWDAAPLAFRQTMLVDHEPTEYGAQTPRADNVYGVDEEIHLYVEPVAFGWTKSGDGWETDMVADVRVSQADGTIIAGHKAFATFNIKSPGRDPDVFLTLTYVFAGLGPGDYVVSTTLIDKVTGKSGAFSTPITIE